MENNYYSILNVSITASEDEIKSSFRSLAKIHHPDRKNGDKDRFQQIQSAFETLSNPQKRFDYDLEMGFSTRQNQQQQQNPFNVFNFGFPFSSGMNRNNGLHNFNQNFRKDFQPQFIKKPEQVFVWTISLTDVKNGISKIFNIRRQKICDGCKIICPSCNGIGNQQRQQNFVVGSGVVQYFTIPCQDCRSTGIQKQKDKKCEICNHSGFVILEKQIDLKVPKCVQNGKRFILEGLGLQNEKWFETAGDQIIEIKIEDHPELKRINETDLEYETEISIFESICGKIITIPKIENNGDKDFEFDVSSWCVIEPNKEYRIKNLGLQNEEGKIGDLILKFKITYPKNLLSKEKINEFREIFSTI